MVLFSDGVDGRVRVQAGDRRVYRGFGRRRLRQPRHQLGDLLIYRQRGSFKKELFQVAPLGLQMEPLLQGHEARLHARKVALLKADLALGVGLFALLRRTQECAGRAQQVGAPQPAHDLVAVEGAVPARQHRA